MKIPSKLTVIKKISSEGNFGEVLLCENTYLLRREAVKLIITKESDEIAIAKELKDNLFESSVLEYLKKSPYIVEIYDAEILSQGFRINMEFLEEGSVQGLLNKRKFLNTKQILRISECVLQALEYAHNKHIFHLDIKPGNILIKNENTYKLSDFGLANIRDKSGTSSFKKIYTKHITPEKLSGTQAEATEQSDIYMFGVTIYRLLNGDLHLVNQWELFKNTRKEAIIDGRFPDRKNYLPHVHKKIKKIVNKCLNIDLKKRYKSVREIRNDLGKIKIKYNWILKSISEKFHHWECFSDGTLYLELIAEKDDNNTWATSLMRYTKVKKLRIEKHCSKELTYKQFYKKLNDIFNEYF